MSTDDSGLPLRERSPPASPVWDDALSAAAEPVDALTAPIAPEITCWRCSLSAPGDAANCPHCAADLTARTPRPAGRIPTARRATLTDDVRALKALLGWYALLLLTGILHAAALEERFADVPMGTPGLAQQVLRQIAVLELVDTAIVLGALLSLRRSGRKLLRPEPLAIAPWLLAGPLLVLLLAVNFAYQWVIPETLQLPMLEAELREIRGWLTVLTLCVQPALVEEAFCRGLAIRLLRRVIGVHSTVMISATMFSLMHVAVLLSMPYLFLVGLALGYLRIASGTIWLPIVVHFFHNLLVLMIEWS